jgi:hypothetical protein
MLLREADASKSVSDHLQFLERVAAGEPMSDAMRQHLVAHIREEETEHQQHLARLIPALEGLVGRLGGPAPQATKPEAKPGTAKPDAAGKQAGPVSGGLTVGSLTSKRPWHVASTTRPQER